MKIITKSNYDKELFTERIVAENVNRYFGEQMVSQWNSKYWHEKSEHYLMLVEDDYVLYDGCTELMG